MKQLRMAWAGMFVLLISGNGIADSCGLEDCEDVPILWEHVDYAGQCLRVPVTMTTTHPSGFGDRASSLCVPDGWQVIFYTDINFEGRKLPVTGPWKSNNIHKLGFADNISSVKVLKKAK
jgi:hypothetical protein